MIFKGIRPRTQLAIDALLFGLLSVLAVSALTMHTALGVHGRFMWHRLHAIAGIGMCLTMGVHLLVHLPWIKSQLARLFSSHQGVVKPQR